MVCDYRQYSDRPLIQPLEILIEDARKKSERRYTRSKNRVLGRYYTLAGRYAETKRKHIKIYGSFDTTFEEYQTKYAITICGLCRLPFIDDNRRLTRHWEHDYKEFWHGKCNWFKGKRSKEEFRQYMLSLRY